MSESYKRRKTQNDSKVGQVWGEIEVAALIISPLSNFWIGSSSPLTGIPYTLNDKNDRPLKLYAHQRQGHPRVRHEDLSGVLFAGAMMLVP